MNRTIDIESLMQDAYGADKVDLLRATVLVWLDLRDNILCELSADQGEWTTPDASKVQLMHQLLNLAREHSQDLVSEKDIDPLLFTVCAQLAKKYRYNQEVEWSATFNG